MLVMEQRTDFCILIMFWTTTWTQDFLWRILCHCLAVVSPSALLLLECEASDVLAV